MTELWTRLLELWKRERRAHQRRTAERLSGTSLGQRVASGSALTRLAPTDIEPAAGGMVRQWLSSPRPIDAEGLLMRPGDPVRLWEEHIEDGVIGVLARVREDAVAVVLDSRHTGELGDSLTMDLDDPQVTFDRGETAIARAAMAAPEHHAFELVRLIGRQRQAEPLTSFDGIELFDSALDDVQGTAVELAVNAPRLALIHGPPGTGKTRVLVEVARQLHDRGQRLLVSAASNAAVDNVAARLLAAGLDVVRLGHPVRVADHVLEATLSERLLADDETAMAKSWLREADERRRRARMRRDRGGLSRSELKGEMRAASALARDARKLIRARQKAIVRAADVIAATCVGSDDDVLSGLDIDTVIVDEATQAVDPLVLIPLLRGRRAVLAGDPQQLPPTVIDPAAARDGLGSTFFERMLAEEPRLGCMLEVQHRMHRDIMAFPSTSMYQGRLRASPEVAGHRLEDLGVERDPHGEAVCVFLDTAGKGWTEERDDDESYFNRQQAERVVAEVRALAERGLSWSRIAVIATYRAQVRLLRSSLSAELAAGLEVATVDAFQGREKDAVIVDLVRCNEDGEVGFLADTRRMNVALTRARCYLLVVGDSATMASHSYYQAFQVLVEEQGGYRSAWSA